MILNMDLRGRNGGGPPVGAENAAGRCGEEESRGGAIPLGEAEWMKDGTSACGVTVPEPVSLLMPLKSPPPLFSSSSSRIRPKTLRTTLPIVNSLGAAATSRFPTLWTLSSNLEDSMARVNVMTLRRRYAVAIAHGFEPLICRLLRRAMKYSVDVSTGSVDTVRRNEAKPGVWRPEEGAMRAAAASNAVCSSAVVSI